MTKNELIQRVENIIEAGRNSAKTNQGRSQIDSITICTEGYAEPGYDDPKSGIIAFGNWNNVTRYDGQEFQVIDSVPGRIATLLEKLGVELDWSDEWCICDGCQKTVRTQANSYRWRPSYADDGSGTVLCHDCIKADPSDYLQSLDGSSNRCITIDLDLEKAGYKLLADDFENGLYGGQSDRPELIAEALRQQGRGMGCVSGKRDQEAVLSCLVPSSLSLVR